MMEDEVEKLVQQGKAFFVPVSPRIKPTGICPRCGRYLDDHDWPKGQPVCRRKL